MIVVDVLLALNLLVLGACALRGRSDRRQNFSWLHATVAEAASSRRTETGDAVILEFRPRRSPAELRAAASMHPSLGGREWN